jgi:hypothetical protein
MDLLLVDVLSAYAFNPFKSTALKPLDPVDLRLFLETASAG